MTAASGSRLLVVDDNPRNLRLLSFLLERRGYDVRTAADAEEVLGLLASWTPALILLDLHLPGMSGYELAQRLRANPRLRRIRLVAVTAAALRGDRARALAAGCDGYITKPIDTRSLPIVIAELLAQAPPDRDPPWVADPSFEQH